MISRTIIIHTRKYPINIKRHYLESESVMDHILKVRKYLAKINRS